MEYLKIPSIYKFGAKSHAPEDFTDIFKALRGIKWRATEKVDGTNTRIIWDGYHITFGGRTDNAQIQPNVMEYLEKTFHADGVEETFEQVFGKKPAIVFGEMFGPKIQKEGGLYGEQVAFRVFDVYIDGYWLSWLNTADVAAKLGLDTVHYLGEDTLNNWRDYVSTNPASFLSPKHEMEGVVCTPVYPLYNRDGTPIKVKIKIKDIRAANRAFLGVEK